MVEHPLTEQDIDVVRMIQCIWPRLSSKQIQGMQHHYSRLISYVSSQFSTVEDNSDLFALRSPKDIFELIRDLRNVSPLDRQQTIDALYRKSSCPRPSEDKVLRSLDVAIKLWLTLDVTSSGIRRPGTLVWVPEKSLHELVAAHFRAAAKSNSQNATNERIPPEVNANALVNTFGFTITWTHNLLEHLTVDWKHKIIAVYEHKICLQNHLDDLEHSIIPAEVLEEAIDTLNLLFPFQDNATKRFLAKQDKPFYGLGFCNRPRRHQLGDFTVWRSQIADLIHICKGPALGLHQLRLEKDGRNLMQFATFWIATVVGILTIVSICIGVVGIVYSSKEYNIALKALKLSIAQACMDPDARNHLDEFCPG